MVIWREKNAWWGQKKYRNLQCQRKKDLLKVLIRLFGTTDKIIMNKNFYYEKV